MLPVAAVTTKLFEPTFNDVPSITKSAVLISLPFAPLVYTILLADKSDITAESKVASPEVLNVPVTSAPTSV